MTGTGKYKTRGAYHWREISRHPLRGWPYTRSRVAWVLKQCAASGTILEIGCGDGVILGQLAKAGKQVVGVDPDPIALDLARRRFAEYGLRGSFYTDLSLVGDRKFDAAILAEVIEHLEKPEAMIRDLIPLLSDRGRLVLTTPIRLLERSHDAYHIHEFWPGELQALMGEYFEEVEWTGMHPVWLVDLMCFGKWGLRPVALVANLISLCTGIEIIDHLPSPSSIFWTQGIVASRPKDNQRP